VTTRPPSAPPHILIVRLGSMGDVIHVLLAVHVLRDALPNAFIGWAIEERWRGLLAATPAGPQGCDQRGPHQPLVDAIHPVNTLAWRSAPFSDETWSEIAAARRNLRARKYDVAIDFQGAVKSALIAAASGAERVIGFERPRERPAGLWYTHTVETTSAHVVGQNVELVRSIPGVDRTRRYASITSSPPDFLPHDPAAERACDDELRRRGIGDFAILNPGAGWGAKQWPPESYGAVAAALRDMSLTSVVNYGPGEDALAHSVERASHGAAQAFPLSLPELIALTRRARLFIGGDTGPTHLAAALHVPVVALFGPTDPARNGPFATRSLVLRSGSSRTSYSHRRQSDEGLLSLTPEDVIAAARSLLENPS